jgi:prevent-host-death family protein
MKSLSMSELRASPGERMIDVRRDGARFLITQAGRPVAKLVPASCDIDETIVVGPDGSVRGQDARDFIAGIVSLRATPPKATP